MPNNNNNNNGASMPNAPYFPDLDHALADLDAAEGSYDATVGGISNYGNEGAAKDAMDEEFDSKLEAIRTKAGELLGGMEGGKRKGRKGKSRKGKASRKARKTRKGRKAGRR
jgi:hypothetical protein